MQHTILSSSASPRGLARAVASTALVLVTALAAGGCGRDETLRPGSGSGTSGSGGDDADLEGGGGGGGGAGPGAGGAGTGGRGGDAEGDPEGTGLDEDGGQNPLHDESRYSRYERLDIVPGGGDTSFDGDIVRGDPDHAFEVTVEEVGEDTTLTASLSSAEDNAVLRVLGPDGTELTGENRAAFVTLPQPGRYLVLVSSSRGNASYSLTLAVSR